tara:strand:+ start:574 stop:759 length:186 start_codon:yes stop_codon:yes gene_type:complete
MLSREFLLDRGYCCGHGCFMCPYEPKHQKGNENIGEPDNETQQLDRGDVDGTKTKKKRSHT